jgi:hypothetical protein
VVTESGSSSRYFSNAETKELFTLGPPGESRDEDRSSPCVSLLAISAAYNSIRSRAVSVSVAPSDPTGLGSRAYSDSNSLD